MVHRLTAKSFEDEDECVWVDDILDDELDADLMVDYYCHYNWIFEGEEW